MWTDLADAVAFIVLAAVLYYIAVKTFGWDRRK